MQPRVYAGRTTRQVINVFVTNDGHVPFFPDSVHKVPKWNFWKFLVNPEGKVVRFWRTDEPLESIRQEVTTLVREIIVKKRVEL